MGGKTVNKTDNDPWGPARPYILENLKQQQAVYNSQQPQLMNYAGMQRDTYGRVAPGAEAGIGGAQALINRNLSGASLGGNPYLDAILRRTRQNVAGTVNDQFGPSGRFGSGMHNAILARELANAENQARYQDYGVERGYQQDAIGQSQALMGGSQSLLNNAAELPWMSVQAANGAVRQASNGYGTQTQTQTQPFNWMGAAQSGLQAGAMFSDRRLKRDIERVGEWDGKGDGLGRYRFSYKFDPARTIYEGVMADEVERLRPAAYIPNFRGEYAGVNYGAL